MNKNLFLLGAVSFCLFGAATLGTTVEMNNTVCVKAEGEPVISEGGVEEEPITPEEGTEETPVYTCSVVLGTIEHATVSVDVTEGNVGDLCTVTVNHDLFYLIDNVTVNNTALVESETTSGVYTFAMVEGVNTINVKCVVDQETLGTLSKIYEEASNKDWANLFTWENVITIMKWVLDGGILIAIARYYIKDKKLEGKVEKTVKDTMNTVIPETTKSAVVTTVSEVVQPMFTQVVADSVETKQAISVLIKCIALMQQNTPEAKAAIVNELSNLGISDKTTLAEIKAYIEKVVNDNMNAYKETMERLENIKKSNQENIIEEEKEEPVVTPVSRVEEETDNGTQI